MQTSLSRKCFQQVNYVVQEAIVVIRDIFRKYPGQWLDTRQDRTMVSGSKGWFKGIRVRQMSTLSQWLDKRIGVWFLSQSYS